MGLQTLEVIAHHLCPQAGPQNQSSRAEPAAIRARRGQAHPTGSNRCTSAAACSTVSNRPWTHRGDLFGGCIQKSPVFSSRLPMIASPAVRTSSEHVGQMQLPDKLLTKRVSPREHILETRHRPLLRIRGLVSGIEVLFKLSEPKSTSSNGSRSRSGSASPSTGPDSGVLVMRLGASIDDEFSLSPPSWCRLLLRG
jgi:hypothetical protein